MTSDQVVDQINHALSLATVRIATDPDNQHRYLSEFALTANRILSQRDTPKPPPDRSGIEFGTFGQ
jgi:hypothetical protein